jgi:hypothetical protein
MASNLWHREVSPSTRLRTGLSKLGARNACVISGVVAGTERHKGAARWANRLGVATQAVSWYYRDTLLLSELLYRVFPLVVEALRNDR